MLQIKSLKWEQGSTGSADLVVTVLPKESIEARDLFNGKQFGKFEASNVLSYFASVLDRATISEITVKMRVEEEPFDEEGGYR